MSEKPAPFVASEVDISGMDGFMLNVQRLFASEIWALSTGDEFKAAVALWGRAWLQTPPGSLPNDDRILAGFSGAGAKWKKVRAIALRGFIECSDGRLYHKTLCEDVHTAWEKRKAFRQRTANATEARRQRNVQRNDDREGSATTTQMTVTETDDKNLYIDERLELEGNPSAGEPDPDFLRFWKVYPLTVGQGDAENAFARARRVASADEIIAGATKYGAERRAAAQPKFDKQAAGWLDAKRWLDHPEAKPAEPIGVFVEHETPQMADWVRHNAGKTFPSATHPDTKRRGWWMPTEWPPGREPGKAAA